MFVLSSFFGSFENRCVGCGILGLYWQTDMDDNFGSNFLSGQGK
jgi:hypothetical protein